ncbi:MAG: phosphatidylserine decarboxylase family protein [Alphaproteobacteria bacterium]|nr:phosphatidylserine decarboxylase family protein [Rickettsiales bacterium]
MPIHSEGEVYIWSGAGVSILLLAITGLSFTTLLATSITLCLCGFFRNPCRVTPEEEGLVVSPADGIVTAIDITSPLPTMGLGDEKMLKVTIFLSVFNVHINRIPIDGKVLKVVYTKGKFEHAGKPKATDHNEHNIVAIETKSGKKMSVVQIAGFVARRIICNINEDDFCTTGESYGIIKFGSRVDLFLPKECKSLVKIGQTMIGGETIISKLD